jgi:hypothetical protein
MVRTHHSYPNSLIDVAAVGSLSAEHPKPHAAYPLVFDQEELSHCRQREQEGEATRIGSQKACQMDECYHGATGGMTGRFHRSGYRTGQSKYGGTQGSIASICTSVLYSVLCNSPVIPNTAIHTVIFHVMPYRMHANPSFLPANHPVRGAPPQSDWLSPSTQTQRGWRTFGRSNRTRYHRVTCLGQCRWLDRRSTNWPNTPPGAVPPKYGYCPVTYLGGERFPYLRTP